MTHTDAWTGETIEGKAYVLQSTEGPELISERTFAALAGAGDEAATVGVDLETLTDVVARLAARVEELETAVRNLTADAPTADPEAPAAATTTRKAAAKS